MGQDFFPVNEVAETVMPVRPAIPVPAALRSYDSKAVSLGTSTDASGESLVQQHFQEEVDINTIVKRFGMTRSMPMGAAAGVYGDFTGIEDYESAVDAIERAQAGFMRLDPVVRERFDNDPGKLFALARTLPLNEFEAAIRAPAAPVVPVAPAAAAPAVPVAAPGTPPAAGS